MFILMTLREKILNELHSMSTVHKDQYLKIPLRPGENAYKELQDLPLFIFLSSLSLNGQQQ